MGEENRSLLEEEIRAEIKRLGSLKSGSQEHTTAVDSLTKLYKLKLEEDKNTYERLDKIENREIDQESKTAQMAESVKDRYFRFGMHLSHRLSKANPKRNPRMIPTTNLNPIRRITQ